MSATIRTMNVPGKGPHPFHGEICPCEHLLQLYDDEGVFLDTLYGFVSGGLASGESVIVIATPDHRTALEGRLVNGNFSVAQARATDRYIPLDAAATLERFMVDGWPDELRFRAVIASVLARAGIGSRRVRAFGEMVGILWAQGHRDATVRLEELWHDLYRSANFSLLCAYPQKAFGADTFDSIMKIRQNHSMVVS
jgi:hypothetical protein